MQVKIGDKIEVMFSKDKVSVMVVKEIFTEGGETKVRVKETGWSLFHFSYTYPLEFLKRDMDKVAEFRGRIQLNEVEI